jgi:three-Cys-motif partner protein
MAEEKFFDDPRENSKIKSLIVEKYFKAWASIVTTNWRVDRILYLDLFCGPGKYDDGTESTPIKVLKTAIADANLRNRLVTIFNDAKPEHCDSLRETIASLEGKNDLKYEPTILNTEVNQRITEYFAQQALIPTLSFLDPFGYKGLTLPLIKSVLKDWGSDCILFFNYNRVNAAINNSAVETHINDLFGTIKAEELRSKLPNMDVRERELTIMEEFTKAIKNIGGEYVLPFTFKSDKVHRTSHHLVFVTKNFRGYEVMKEIMANSSSGQTIENVATFEYDPASSKYPTLFAFAASLQDLGASLVQQFRGKTMTMQEIYEVHNVGTPFIKKHYKAVLKDLERTGKITAKPSENERRKNTFGDDVQVTFLA